MKKIFSIFITILLTILVTSCDNNEKEFSVIAPSGTPALALTEYFANFNQNYAIVSGSDPLVAAFTNKTHDIIVAPVNLGAKMYQVNQTYIHYKTIIWGNTYIVSTQKIKELSDLEDKDIVAFGETSVPGIVLQILLDSYNIKCNITYVDDVATANAMLKTGKAETILTAEPSLSKINNGNYSIIDLQKCWANLTGGESYPQAAVFFNKKYVNNEDLKTHLEAIDNAINKTNDLNYIANLALKIDESFNKIGIEALIKAIPNCNFKLVNDEKTPIEQYFNLLKKQGFSAMFGGNLPDEEFYFKK